MPRLTLLFAVMLAALLCKAQQSSAYGIRPDGREVVSLAPEGTKAVALFFVASDCPISNRTFPEMKRLREQFAPRGVRFWFVYPNQGERPEQVIQHQAAYDNGGEVLLDTTGRLAQITNAHVTPEVSVLIPDAAAGWRPVYTGRIDDRYIRLGLERPKATAHFAERTLTAVLAGAPVEPATGTPVGCSIIHPTATPAGSHAR